MDGFATESLTGCLHLSWEASGEALCQVLYEGGEKGPWFFAESGRWEMALPSPRRFRVAAQGLDGAVTLGPWVELPGDELTPPSVAITEIYANPVGKEPAQEYIELMNVSDLPVELEGYRLTDTLDATGDILPSFLLEAGERVVVVGSTWQPGSDDPVPAGEESLMVLQNSLVNAGISNSGEPLYLFSPDGRLESRYLGWRLFTGNEGLSAERSVPLACDVDGNWRLVAPTPGE